MRGLFVTTAHPSPSWWIQLRSATYPPEGWEAESQHLRSLLTFDYFSNSFIPPLFRVGDEQLAHRICGPQSTDSESSFYVLHEFTSYVLQNPPSSFYPWNINIVAMHIWVFLSTSHGNQIIIIELILHAASSPSNILLLRNGKMQAEEKCRQLRLCVKLSRLDLKSMGFRNIIPEHKR